MSIEYRGENKYRFRIRKDGLSYSKNYISNKSITEKDIIENKYPKDVIDEHKKFEVDIMTNNIGTNENMKFYDLAQMVMDEHVRVRLKPTTQNSYLNAYNTHILEHFGAIKLSKIKKIHVQKFINEKAKELKPSTTESLYTILRATFSKAVEWEIIKDNPCRKITLPKVERKNYTELLSAVEISDLINAIENEKNEIYRIIFLIALYCGLRQGEILGLTVNDINLTENYINVNKQYVAYIKDNKSVHEIADTKTTNSVRKVFMPEIVGNALKKYISNMKTINIKEQYLFINKKTNQIYDHNAVYRRFKKMLKENNLKEITFHDLRHLQATMLINSGANVVVVAKRLGDTVETVSNTYLHSIEEVEKESVGHLENFVYNIRSK